MSSKSLTNSAIKQLTVPASPKFVFVGGKGGVGKTTSSSAIALQFSDNGFRTLVVSTDPAHSLGDALDVNLSSGKIVPITSEQNLYGLEIDVEAALNELRQSVGPLLDSDALAQNLGIPKNFIDSLGLDDIADLFVNPPPGIDEIVALTKILKYAESQDGSVGFDRIVIDTAPTGHTIRLLQLPEFLSNLTVKLIRFRSKLSSAMSSFKKLFGGSSDRENAAEVQMEKLLVKLEALQSDLVRVKNTLKDESSTQFVVVCIPTQLAVAESKRLVESLQSENIFVSTILCNQVMATQADMKYVENRVRGQQRAISGLKSFLSSSSSKSKAVEVTEVGYVDTEVTGVYGLRFFHRIAHPSTVSMPASNPISSRKVTIFGGKGGVGKTTSSASWAVKLSDSGFKTLVVSSDPAHSLGDALQERLTGQPRLIDQNNDEGGQLWAMEVDPVEGLNEFKSLGDLADLLYGAKDPPPGTDEIVALTNIVKYLDQGYRAPDGTVIKFDRIVIDTAPTGHTLRMLQLPAFMQKLMQNFKTIRDKTDSFGGIMGMMSGSGAGGRGGGYTEAAAGSDKVTEFQNRMARLEELLHSADQSEFTVVTIPTEVAAAETRRLLLALEEEKIAVRRVIINQIIPTPSTDSNDDTKTRSYLDRLRLGQQKSLDDLKSLATLASAPLIEVPYFDTEVRTVYGLRVISKCIFPTSS
eukprot:gene23968-32370_t